MYVLRTHNGCTTYQLVREVMTNDATAISQDLRTISGVGTHTQTHTHTHSTHTHAHTQHTHARTHISVNDTQKNARSIHKTQAMYAPAPRVNRLSMSILVFAKYNTPIAPPPRIPAISAPRAHGVLRTSRYHFFYRTGLYEIGRDHD